MQVGDWRRGGSSTRWEMRRRTQDVSGKWVMQVGGSGADEERAISGEGERRARQEGSSSSEAYLRKNKIKDH